MDLSISSAVWLVWAVAAETRLSLTTLVERYRAGDREAAVREVATWPRERLQQQIARVQWRLQRKEDLGVPLTLIVMLHTDAAMLNRAHRRPFASDVQTEAALALVRLVRADPMRASFARRWYLAAASYEQGLWDAERARRLLEEARRQFPQDAELLVTLGSVDEMEGSLPPPPPPEPGVARPGSIVARSYDTATHDRREELLKAEETYRQALALEPTSLEGRLRRARVLARLGQGAEALAELGRVLEGQVDERTRYLAHLFTGHELEAEGRLEDAAAAYRQAVEATPHCQAGRLALAHALDRLRSRESAAEILLQAVAPDDGAGGRRDPWWTYPFGQADRVESMLDALRREAGP
jgi:tetratricopeptide (TPR) repeat protein